jgi:hypothetical protein
MADSVESETGRATWICFSCDEQVEFDEPLVNPQFLTDLFGRTTFRVDGSEVHQCSEGSYHAPLPTLRRLQ